MIKKMLLGEISMQEFQSFLKCNTDLQVELSSLVPQDAKNNPFHPLWKCYPYLALKQYNFDFYAHLLKICRFNGTAADNLNVFSTIKKLYCFHFPEIICTTIYEDAFDLYLDVIKDCYDGPEVTHLVDQLIKDMLSVKGKGNRRKAAKEKVMELFHITDTKRPRWVHGPEWPMGITSPMVFISQKKKGEVVHYIFQDVDTGTIRVIEQFY